MAEPMELELPAMLAYCSFPEEWFNAANLYHKDVKRLDTIIFDCRRERFRGQEGRGDSCKADDHLHQQDSE